MSSVWQQLGAIFGSLYGAVALLSLALTPLPKKGVWLPPATNASKRAGELLSLWVSPLWIASVGAHSAANSPRAGSHTSLAQAWS
jgi:hypothetical protein